MSQCFRCNSDIDTVEQINRKTAQKHSNVPFPRMNDDSYRLKKKYIT